MTAHDSAAGDDRLDAAMAEYLALLESGRRPDKAAFLAARPDVAGRLAPELDGIDALHGVGRQVGTDAAATAPAVPLDRPARVGGFEVVGVVGRGGMGVVYEAVEAGLNRRVALKVLPAAAALDPRAKRRFQHEARTAALIQHPHVVPVLSVGEADGVPYYAMPLIDGQSLDAVLRTLRRRDGVAAADEPDDASSRAGLLATGLTGGFEPAAAAPPTPAVPAGAVRANPQYLAEVVRLAQEAADGLAAAHAAGVIHRDVKPGNLLLDVRGKVWLTDFGLATVAAADAASSGVGRAGTLRYMSPEQAAGRAGEADERADVYALGLTLYELLTLRPAFAAAADADLLRLIATADPPPVRSLNPVVSIDLETVVQTATAKRPADRYPSAAALAADLARVRGGRPPAARRLTRVQRAARWAMRHRRRLAAFGGATAAGVLTGLAASTLLLLAAYRQAEAERARVAAREDSLLAVVDEVDRAGRVLKELPGSNPERLRLTRAMHAVLALSADEPGASVRVRRAAVRAALRLVAAEGTAGDQPAARRAAADALARSERLTADPAADWEDRLDLAQSCLCMAGGLHVSDDPGEIDYLRRCERVYTGLEADRPDDPAVLNHLGQVRRLLAHERARHGDDPAAVGYAERGLEVNRRLAGAYPKGHPLSYFRLFHSHLTLTEVHGFAGRPAAAEPHYRAAVEAEERYEREAAATGVKRLDPLQAAVRYGMFLVGQGRYADARSRLDRGLAAATAQAAGFPDERGYRAWVARGQMELGRLSYLARDEAEARGRFARVADGPDKASFEWVALAACIPVPGVVDANGLLAAAEAATAALPADHVDRYPLALAYLRAGHQDRAEPLLLATADRLGPDRHTAAALRYYAAVCQARRREGGTAAARATIAAADATNWRPTATTGMAAVARREAEAAVATAEREPRR